MLLPFQNPASVIQRSPMSGVFGSSKFLEDKEGFVSKLLGHWYCIQGNTISVEGPQHIKAAEDLHEFYRVYRQQVEGGLKGYHLAIYKLYQTGSIEQANQMLKTLKAEQLKSSLLDA